MRKPHGFETFHFPDHVLKLKKTLSSLKQTPRACYDILKSFLLDNDFNIGKIKCTPF